LILFSAQAALSAETKSPSPAPKPTLQNVVTIQALPERTAMLHAGVVGADFARVDCMTVTPPL
jgi:hypothetical protein